MMAIFRRDIQKFLNNPYAILMALAMPVLYLMVFGNAIGGTITGLPVGVVQELPSVPNSHDFETGVYYLQSFKGETDQDPLFILTRYSSETAAQDALAHGEIYGYVVFPSNLSQNREIRVYVDSSDYSIPALIRGGVSSSINQAGIQNPIRIVNIYGTIKYVQYFGVGVIVLAIFMSTLFGGALAIIKDRELGIIEGYFVTPLNSSSIIFGTILGCTVKAFLAGVTVFIFNLLLTGVMIESFQSFLLAILIIILTSVGVSSLVVTLATRFKGQQEFSGTIGFFNLFFFITSGIFYPVVAMPFWLKWITIINPNYYAIVALRSIVLRGQGLEVIWIDILALVVFTIGMMILGVLSYHRRLD